VKIFDISMSISKDMQVYKNKPEKKPIYKVTHDFSTGKIYESAITMDMHTGTHVDAPLHVIQNGKTIDDTSLEKLITNCKVVNLTKISEKISASDLLEVNIEMEDFILFKTKNSFTDEFKDNFVYLDESGAKVLRDKKIKGVGIDSLGIERDQPGYPTHKLLLQEGIVILEGLRLKDIEEGEYTLLAVPLKIEGVEACPVRAILLNGIL
jgi:arylformamidase